MSEAKLAELAGVRFLPSVNEHVRFELVLSSKIPATLLTVKRFFTGVSSLVSRQVI